MIVIDDNGMPKAPDVRQLMDKDIRTLYQQDKSKDKSQYIKDCIVIYYMGDPKSPAKQVVLAMVKHLKWLFSKMDYQLTRSLINLLEK